MIQFESSFIEGFLLLNKFFAAHKMRYCLFGGIAAGYWGEPRYTRDMDFVVVTRTGNIKKLLNELKKEKFKFEKKGDWQIKIQGKGNLVFLADIILAETEYQDWVVQRAKPVKIFDVSVPICSPEDLIILKLIANRRQDLLDIEKILARHWDTLNKQYLKEWFAFWEIEKLFKQEFGANFPLIM